MGHHDVLTELDIEGHSPNYRMLAYLDEYISRDKPLLADINVLDYGCGRGRDVIWLNSNGYSAFGVDIDSEAIGNGKPLFIKMGIAEDRISILSDLGRSEYSDEFFNFTFSNQAFEHVENLKSTAKELYRITKPGGAGYHRYTANRTIIEEHLKMPFIHWLPKNSFRKAVIHVYVRMGMDPSWVPDISIAEQVDCYFKYSMNGTFYRPYRLVKSIFEQEGFIVKFGVANHPKLTANPIAKLLLPIRPMRSLLESTILTFKTVELLIVKPS